MIGMAPTIIKGSRSAHSGIISENRTAAQSRATIVTTKTIPAIVIRGAFTGLLANDV